MSYNSQNDLVAGKVFFIHGYEKEKFTELQETLQQNGAIVVDQMDESVSYIVSSPMSSMKSTPDIQLAINYGIPILNDQLLYKLVEKEQSSNSTFHPLTDDTAGPDLQFDPDSLLIDRATQPQLNSISEDYAQDQILSSDVAFPFVPPTTEPQDGQYRLQWQQLLATYLTGDEFHNEKLKLSSETQHAETDVIWLSLRCSAYGLTDMEHCRTFIERSRSKIPQKIEHIQSFKVDHKQDLSEQVERVMRLIEEIYELYPSASAAEKAWQQLTSEPLSTKIAALTSWYNCSIDLDQTKNQLCTWAEIKQLEEQIPEVVIERTLKEIGILDTFKLQMLVSLPQKFTKIYEICQKYEKLYEEINLECLYPRLLSTIWIPTKVMELCLTVRLQTVKGLLSKNTKTDNVSHQLFINEWLDDFRDALPLATQVKRDFLRMSRLIGQEKKLDAVDRLLQESLNFYLQLLLSKYKSDRPVAWFKDVETLETEWEFLKKISQDIYFVDLAISENLCLLTEKLFGSVLDYLNKAMQPPRKLDEKGMIKWFNRILENIRLRSRKIMQFSRAISNDVENCSDYCVVPDRVDKFSEILMKQTSQYTLIESSSVSNYLVLASKMMMQNEVAITEALRPCFWSINYKEKFLGHLLIVNIPGMNSEQWTGERKQLDIEIKFEIGERQIRLITTCSSNLTVEIKEFTTLFLQSKGPDDTSSSASSRPVEDIKLFEVIRERRCISDNVHEIIQRMRTISLKFCDLLLKSVKSIRVLTGSINCVDLIENCFCFVSDFGYRTANFVGNTNARVKLNRSLIEFAIEWVSFTCSDCSPMDKRTFRWALMALEFVMLITRGSNIMQLSPEAFHTLRSKVACCMTLLISHFDSDALGVGISIEDQLDIKQLDDEQFSIFQGVDMTQFKEDLLARSQQDLQSQQQLQSISNAGNKNHNRLQAIEVLEQRLHSKVNVGKVLDQDQLAEQGLTELLASSSITLRWQQGKFLGSGAFGSVYIATNLDSVELMAVKEISFHDPASVRKLVKSIKEEMKVLEVLHHPNLINYYGIEVHRDKAYIFMEYCSNGSLRNLLENGPIEDELVVQLYTFELLKGLEYLHSHNIVHRDIKPDNILIDHNGTIKLVDFGGAKMIQEQPGVSVKNQNNPVQAAKASLTGTPSYMAPEVVVGKVKDGVFGCQDIWSLGCVVLEMKTGKRPWSNLDNDWAIMYQIGISGQHPPIDTAIVEPLNVQFLQECFKPASQRPTVAQLLALEYFKDLNVKLGEYRKKFTHHNQLYPNPWTGIGGFVNGLNSPGWSPSVQSSLKSSYFPSLVKSFSLSNSAQTSYFGPK